MSDPNIVENYDFVDFEGAKKKFKLQDFQIYQAGKAGILGVYTWDNLQRPLHPDQLVRGRPAPQGVAVENPKTDLVDKIFETPYGLDGRILRPHLLSKHCISECLFKETDLKEIKVKEKPKGVHPNHKSNKDKAAAERCQSVAREIVKEYEEAGRFDELTTYDPFLQDDRMKQARTKPDGSEYPDRTVKKWIASEMPDAVPKQGRRKET